MPERLWMSAALATLALICLGGIPSAKATGSAVGDVADQAKQAQLFPGAPRVLEEAWLSAAARLDSADYGTARYHLDRVATMRSDLGIANLHKIGRIVASHAEAALRDGQERESEELMSLARRMAPNSHHVEMTTVAMTLENSPWSLGTITRGILDGSAAMWSSLPGRI